jgi:uncharacterized membrane protein
MTESFTPPPAIPPPAPSSSPFTDERQMAIIIYILYLVSFANGFTVIIGLVLAYVNRDTAPDWLKSHYTFQIRTFWIGLLYACVAGLACFILIGLILLPVVAIWFIVRIALGMSRLMRNEAYPTPASWAI